MTPDQRRKAIKRLLDDDPTLGQRAIAKALNVSQKTVSRDVVELRAAKAWGVSQPVTHPDSQQVSRKVAEPSPQVSRGDALVARLRAEVAEQGLVFTSTEEEQLTLAHDLADRIELLQDMIAADGESVAAKDGGVRLHPAIAEVRQQQGALSRTLAGINTMAQPMVNRSKQRAAESRWRVKHRATALTSEVTPSG
jgi:predicted DNA-binding transcriptional regulator YafY